MAYGHNVLTVASLFMVCLSRIVNYVPCLRCMLMYEHPHVKLDMSPTEILTKCRRQEEMMRNPKDNIGNLVLY